MPEASMRIRAHVFLLTTVLVSLSVGSFARAASSPLVSYTFSGTLKSVTGLPGSAVGDLISGSVAYDSSQLGSTSTGLYTFTGSSKVHTLTFKIFNLSNQQIFSDSYTGDASVATGGLYTAQVSYNSATGTNLDISGDTITKYDGGLGSTGVAFDLTLNDPTSAGPTGGYGKANNLVLPSPSIISSDFGLTTGLLSWDPIGLSFTTNSLILTPTSVPEPSSLHMAILGLSTCAAGCGLVRRRRAAETRHQRSDS
jgi:hypothetical protein